MHGYSGDRRFPSTLDVTGGEADRCNIFQIKDVELITSGMASCRMDTERNYIMRSIATDAAAFDTGEIEISSSEAPEYHSDGAPRSCIGTQSAPEDPRGPVVCTSLGIYAESEHGALQPICLAATS